MAVAAISHVQPQVAPGAALSDRAGGRVPATVAAEGDPTAEWPPSWRSVVSVLRGRPRGTTARHVATLAGLAQRQAQQALEELADRGFVRCSEEKVLWGCEMVGVALWRLDLTESCARALAFLPRRQCGPAAACPSGVPAEFWAMFWSGSRGSDARLPRDAFHVACTLLDCPDRAAQTWALAHLPVATLQQCRTMRGFDVGEIAAALDAEIAERRRLASA